MQDKQGEKDEVGHMNVYVHQEVDEHLEVRLKLDCWRKSYLCQFPEQIFEGKGMGKNIGVVNLGAILQVWYLCPIRQHDLLLMEEGVHVADQ